MSAYLTVFLLLLLARTGVELLLERRNRNRALACRDNPPDAVEAVMDRATFARSVDYTVARSRFNAVEAVVGVALLVGLVFSGVAGLAHSSMSGVLGDGVWGQALVVLILLLGLSLVQLPLSWYETFRLETRYGFNRSTPGLWWADRGKGVVLALVIGAPLLALLLAVTGWLPGSWWLAGWAIFFGFQLLMAVVYPMWILPWFNKLTPLAEGELRDRLFALARRTGFGAQEILVMDGSRRSAHSNAFFTGFGRFRRIVLYDTLVEQLDAAEVEAVLAHEIGHYRKGHVPRMLAIFGGLSLAGFYLLFALARDPGFVAAFGFVVPVDAAPLRITAPAFMLFLLLSGSVGFWLSPVLNRVSRRHEYEADRFARDAVGGADPLVGALRRIYRENLGNLVPDSWYSAFHYSHPTLPEREAALRT